MSEVSAVELVSVEYDWMNDWPTQPSVLIRNPVTVTRASLP